MRAVIGNRRRDRAAIAVGYRGWEDFLTRVRDVAKCQDIAVRWAGLTLKPAGEGWMVSCPFHADRTPSMHLNGNLYYCHGAGCGAGGDAISFAMRIGEADFVTTILDLADDFDLPVPVLPVRRNRSVARQAVVRTRVESSPVPPCVQGPAAWPIGQPPKSAPKPGNGGLPVWFRRSGFGSLRANAWYSYRSGCGQLIALTARLEKSGGGKVVLPVTWRVNAETGTGCWAVLGFGAARRPVYGMERLADRKEHAAILVVEGEKAADSGHRMLGTAGWACISPMGGGKSSHKADWRPLAAFVAELPVRLSVAVWPDADRRPGKHARLPAAEAADRVLTCLAEALGGVDAFRAKADCRVLLPPEDLPHGWDLADAERRGLSPDWAAKRLAGARVWTGPHSGWDQTSC